MGRQSPCAGLGFVRRLRASFDSSGSPTRPQGPCMASERWRGGDRYRRRRCGHTDAQWSAATVLQKKPLAGSLPKVSTHHLGFTEACFEGNCLTCPALDGRSPKPRQETFVVNASLSHKALLIKSKIARAGIGFDDKLCPLLQISARA